MLCSWLLPGSHTNQCQSMALTIGGLCMSIHVNPTLKKDGQSCQKISRLWCTSASGDKVLDPYLPSTSTALWFFGGHLEVLPTMGAPLNRPSIVGFSIINHPFWDTLIFRKPPFKISCKFDGELHVNSIKNATAV
jgi:hypothetical protein